ncbi:hypothetical protein [Pseudomonas koreensis]|uniref:hypothetical protein n=1 Tax=Pseudomonas koreensis TaxID=198620 RepID=UPI0018E6B023|nr:hypothetical protein [Pseudomonas koreensis]MBI6948770.1 hypothetical protein [Pseudomonas koreensis]
MTKLKPTDLLEMVDVKPEPELPPNWLNVVARKKLGQSEEWRWCKFEMIGDTDDCLVEGGIPRLLQSGKRKGQPTWHDSKLTKCVVTKAEHDQAKVDYEAETGKCCKCAGSGLWLSGWGVDTGNRFKPCVRCGATGKAPEVQQ